METGTTIAETVRAVWASVLDVPEVEVSDGSDFFADGGDSLLAVEIAVALGDALGTEVPLDSMFLDGRFSALVAAAEEARAAIEP